MNLNPDPIPIQAPDTYKSRPKKTEAEVLADLEKNGVDFTPEGLGPWSTSKLKVLAKCPLKFYLQYILKRDPQGPVEPSLVTEYGKACHRILEFVLGGDSVPEAFAKTREEYRKVLTDEQWAENVEITEYNIGKFKQRIDEFGAANGVKAVHQELRVGVTRDWKPTKFFAGDVYYRGVIDFVVELKNGDIVIIDHKYGTVAAMGLRNFKDQLDCYKLLFHKGVKPVEGAQSGIHHIKEGEVSLDYYADKEEIEGSILQLLEFSIQAAIDSVIDLGEFSHKAGALCKYCDYRVECKGGALKELEKDSRKWFQLKKAE